MKRLFILFILLPNLVFCVDEAAFLKIESSTRNAAMGEATTSIGYGLPDIYSNPASLGVLNNMEFMAGYGKWFVDIGHSNFGLAIRPKESDNIFALSAIGLSAGDFEKRNEDGELLGTFGVQDYSICLSYARGIKKTEEREEPMGIEQYLRYGITLKYLYEKIEDDIATGYCMDAGAVYSPYPDYPYSVGFVLKNLGPGLSEKTIQVGTKQSFPPPMKTQIGAAYIWEASPMIKTVISCDIGYSFSGMGGDIRSGVEGDINKMLFLRCGIKYPFTEQGKVGFAGGVGCKIGEFCVDYAYLFQYIEATHRVSTSIKF